MTERRSVTEVGTARDEVTKRVAELAADMSDEGIDLEGRVDLTAPSGSRNLAEHRFAALRAIQMRQAAERAELTYLRGEILSKPGLARIWWMRQPPELISALGEAVFTAAVEEAIPARTSSREDATGDDDLLVLRDFVRWLREDDAMAVAVLRSFDTILRLYGRSDLQSRLQSLHPGLAHDGMDGAESSAEHLREADSDGVPPSS